MSRQSKVGLALSGGGALGGAHVGVLEVLHEHGIKPDCVAGTSAGSAVGVAYCAGLSLPQIREVALTLRWSKLGRMVRPASGFFDGERLEKYMTMLIGDRTFQELPIPFACAATDILRDELVVFRDGRVAHAVRASCAFPGIFTPVKDGERLLVDGGLICNLPVAVLRDMGADYVIAVDLMSPPRKARRPPATIFEMWFYSLSTLMRNTSREAELANVVISPDVGEYNGFDLQPMEALIAAGRLAATMQIVRIRRDLGLEQAVES